MSYKYTAASIALLAALAFSGSASAGQGDWLLRVGASNVSPDSSSDQIDVVGGEAEVDDDTQLSLTVSYFLTDNWAVEVLGALPFTHMVSADGGALDGTDLVEITMLPPTVSAQYHFLPSNNIRPYVGAGLTYFWVLDEKQKQSLVDVKVDNSFGVAIQAGVDVDVHQNWFVNADIRYINLSTEADISGAVNQTLDVDINPWVYTLAVGYKF